MLNGKQAMERVLGEIPGRRIIDVASGAGSFTSQLNSFCAECTLLLATDVNVSSLQALSSSLKSTKLATSVMDAGKLAAADASFHVASISNSLHHMSNPSKVLEEMMRVLEPGGVLVIQEMFADGDQTPAQITHTLMHNWWGALDTADGKTHNSVYSKKELESLVESTGLENIKYVLWEDLSADPFDENLKKSLQQAQDRCIQNTGENLALREQGEQAWKHFLNHGFAGARTLIATGNKPI